MDPSAIGLVTGVGACALIAAIAFWGHVGDRVLGRRATLQVCTVVAIAVAIGIGLPLPLAILPPLTIAFACTQGSLLALTDAVVVSTLRNPGRDYGRIRMMGSISFGSISILVGFVYDRLGYPIASVFYVGFALLLILATFGIEPGADHVEGSATATTELASPSEPAAHQLANGRTGRFGSAGLAFRSQPQLIPVLATVALTWSAVVVSSGFFSLRMVALGGQPSDVALSFGVSAICEIPGMILAARLASRIGLRGLFCLGTLGFAAAFLSWSVLTSPMAIVATRTVTGLSFACMTVAMVLTIGQLLPNHLQATGQALLQGTLSGIAALIGNVVGGLLYGGQGPAVLFIVCAVTCVLGGAIALVTLPDRVRLVEASR